MVTIVIELGINVGIHSLKHGWPFSERYVFYIMTCYIVGTDKACYYTYYRDNCLMQTVSVEIHWESVGIVVIGQLR